MASPDSAHPVSPGTHAGAPLDESAPDDFQVVQAQERTSHEFKNPLGRSAGFTRSVDVFTRQWGFWIFLVLVVIAVVQVLTFLAVSQLDLNNSRRDVEAPPPVASSSPTP